MGVSEQIQEELRQGRTPEEVLELLKTAVKALFADPSIDVWSTVIGDFARKGDPDAHEAKAALETAAASQIPDVHKAATEALAKLEAQGR